ncbi:MAG: hypothetical protein VX642_04055 [Bdellovibrionota bacterium]|nr:hypothetical protein [Bdellovibrionota bacterium]
MKRWSLNTLVLILVIASLAQTSMVFATEDVKKQTSCANAAASQSLDLERGDLLKVLEVQKEFPMLNQRLMEMEMAGKFDFVQTAERIVEYLVNTKQMTQEMGNEVFANKILSEYSPIFLKFILAELYSRAYSKDDIIGLLESYDGLLDRISQLDIARGVIKRMLLFVNERPGVSGPEGLRHFKFMSSILSVSEPTYKSFLKMWRYLVSSRLDLLMEYTLLQLQYLSSDINLQKQDLESSRASIETGNGFWGKLRKRPQLTKIEKEIDTLVDLNVHPILVGDKLGYNIALKAELPGNIERVAGNKKTFNDFKNLQGVFDMSSVLVREYIFTKLLPHLSIGVLKKFINSSLFESFSSSFKSYALEEYEKLEALRIQLFEIRSLMEGGINRELIGNAPGILERYNKKLEGYAKASREIRESGLSIDSLLEKLILEKNHFMEELGFQLSSKEYFLILISTISMTILSENIGLIEKVLGYLATDSQNYKLTREQRAQIQSMIYSGHAYVNGMSVDLRTVKQISSYMKAEYWGYYDGPLARETKNTSLYHSGKIKEKIGGIRSYLTKEEDLLSDPELLTLIGNASAKDYSASKVFLE